MTILLGYRQKTLKKHFVLTCIVVLFSFYGSFAQTPVTQYECDPRSTANGGNCPTGCDFPANEEKGCNCFDNIDNDGDGKTDAADISDCATYFGLNFVGPGSDCSVTPPGALTPFDLVGPHASSGQNTADTQSKVIAGDVDGNGTPDLVISSKWNSEIRLVSTATSVGLPQFGGDSFDEGDIIADFNADGNTSNTYFQSCDGDPLKKRKFEHEVLTADIDGDGVAEIFAVASNRGGDGPTSPPTTFWLLALKLDEYGPGGLKPMYNAVCLGRNRPGTFGIADMDGDGKAEIYLRDRIFAAETGKLLASEGGKLMTGSGTARWDVDVTSAPVAVDMDHDLTMELVCGAQIYKIPSLTNRNPASPGTLTLWQDMNTLSFDVNSDGVNDKYYVKLMNDNFEYGEDTHSSCSVADVDKDGNVDVVLSGAIDFPLGATSSGRTTVFYWNLAKNRVTGMLTPSSLELGLTPAQAPDYANYITGWIWGTGRVNIGDANGDGNLDFSYIAGAHLFCMTPDVASGIMSSVWAPSGGEVLAVNVPSSSSPSTPIAYRQINDTRSGVLTVTIYDFDNNGVPEMVYRDSQELRVIYGTTGLTTSFARTCFSHTYTEGPIVADVNGDGNTDIAVACNRSDNPSQFNISAPINNQNLGEVRIWYSDGEWLPTRQVWNQPGYFVVNINDDLTLPWPQFDIATQFGNVICPSGIPGPQTPFNVFLNQVPFVNADGCPVFPAPDLEFVGQDPNDPLTDPNAPGYFPTVFVESPICGNLDIKVGYNVTNSGDLPINTTIPVSFYEGSPYDLANPGSLLHSTTIVINNLSVGDTLSIGDLYDGNGNLIRSGDLPFIEFDGPGTTFELYVVLYNDGTVLPIDTTAVSNGIECDITNNYWPITVVPKPFTVNIDSIDNVKCIDTAPDNGQLISHISIGPDTVTVLNPYSFQWYLADQVTPAGTLGMSDTDYYITDLPEGDYYLVISDTTKGCSSDPILGQVVRGSNLGVEIRVDTLSNQRSCTPPDGSLQAVITSGTSAGVTWSWSDEFGQSLGVSGPILTGVPQGRYIVEALKNGCPAIAENVVQDFTNEPDVTGTVLENVVNCLNANSGSITAEAFVGGVAQDSLDYQFDWYFYDTLTAVTGSILPSSDGRPTRKGLAPGSYKVVVTETATGCTAGTSFDIVTITDATVLPDIEMVELAPQTSCDASQPNGRLQADAVIGGVVQDPATFTFEWFLGQNTVTPHTGGTSGTNGQIAENVMGGGQSYTVRITTQNDCSVTMDTVIAEVINYPEVGLVTTPNSVCDQQLGFTGSVTSTVTFDGVTITAGDPNYTWTWYDGPIEDPAEERTADLNQQAITQLDSGFYTLVVENTLLHCPSVANVEQVLSIKALPLITMDSDSSTNCAPNMPGNGRAFVSDVDSTTPDGSEPYSYQWYTSTDTTGNVIPGEIAFELTDIQGGPTADYTVLVRNNTSGCENISSVNVSDQHVLPLLSATVLPDNICDVNLVAPGITRTGEVTLTIDNQGTTPIGDYAFDWTAEEPGVGPFTTQNLTQVDSGYYTVTVLQTVTGCESEITRFVPATTTLPVIQTLGTPSTNCEPLVSGNGSVEVISIDGNNPPVGNYTYQWYTSTDTTGNAIGGATQALMANIQGGSGIEFTVLVIDRSNGCANISDEQVLDNHLNPVIAITPTPNTICNADLSDNDYTGAVTSVITNLGTSPLTGALSDYLYTWTDLEDGTIIKNGVTGGANAGELITALDSSDYSLTVVHQPTGCVSNLDVTTVDLDVSPPTLSATMTPSTNCLPEFADGTAYLSLANGSDPAVDPQNFVWQWYAAQDTSAADLLAGETDYIIIDRQGGPDEYYTVLATNRDDGCQNTATVKITDAKTRPVITLGSTPNQQCEGTPGGTAFLNTVTYKGVTLTRPDPFAGFTFGWASGQTTDEITNQPKGVYKLAVTSNVGCTSDTVQTQIVDQLVYPVTVFQKTPQTSCDINNPNGDIIAGVTQIPTDPGFSFTWFTDNLATTPLNVANVDAGDPSHAINLPGNRNFTVIVQNTTTLCRDTVSTFLQEILRIPVIAVNATPITDCNVPGFVTATVNIDLDGNGTNDWTSGDTRFQFTWYRGKADQDPVTDPMLPETGEVLNFLDAGMTMTLPVDNYAAFVTDTQTSCASEIEFDFVNGPPPLFGISSQVNFKPASCGPETGAVTAYVTTAGPTVTGYTFEWYAGAPVDPSKTFYTDPPVEFVGTPLETDQFALQGTANYPIGALPGNQATTGTFTGPTLYGRATGTYSVVVTRADGCQEYHTTFMPFETAPAILVADIKPTECDEDNGEVGLTLDPDPDNTTGNVASQYRLWLLEGTNPDLSVSPNDPSPFLQNIPAASGDPVTDRFVGLGPGTYTAVAQEDPADGLPNGCFSNPVTFTMVSALPPNLNALAFEENTNCGLTTLGDGSMQITFNMREDDPYHINYLPQPIPPAQFITTPVEYSVQVFEVSTSSTSNLPGPYASGAMVDILNMRNGDFDVTVTSTAGCAVTKRYTIGAAPVVAELVDGDLTIDNSFTCDPGGAIEVTTIGIVGQGPGSGVIGEYEFKWFKSKTDAENDANVISVGQGDVTADTGGDYFDAAVLGQPTGTYWVVARKTTGPGTGCLSAPFDGFIDDLSENPSGQMYAFNNTACTDSTLPPIFEGRLEIEISDAGSLAAGSGYTYTWLTATASSALQGTTSSGNNADRDGTTGPDDDNPTGLEHGAYVVRVENDDTGCFTDLSGTIDQTELPVIISDTDKTDQLICLADGSMTVLEVQVNSIPAPIADFEFYWYETSTTTPTILEGPNETVLNPASYMDMGAGTYHVIAVRVASSDGGPGYGCRSPKATEIVLDESEDPVFQLTPLSNTSCSDVTFEGSISILVTDEGSAAAGAAGYKYEWTEFPVESTAQLADLSPGDDNDGNADGDGTGDQDNPTGLLNGTYKLTATNNTSGCSTSEEAIITLSETPVIISKVGGLDRFVCAPSGRAFVTEVIIDSSTPVTYTPVNPAIPMGAAPFSPNIRFAFYEGFPLADSSNLVYDGLGESHLDSLRLPDIKATTYYVVAQNKFGPGLDCQAREQIVINDKSLDPEFKMTPFSNTSCDLVTFDGSISVEVTTPGSLPATDGYDYTWVATPTPGTPADSDPLSLADNFNGDGTGVDGDNPTGLKDGTYTLKITNANTLCESRDVSTTIGIEGRPNVTVSLGKIDKFFCLESGQIFVKTVSVGTTTYDDTQFDPQFSFEFFEGSSSGTSVLQGINQFQLDSITYAHPTPTEEIKAGVSYFVVATNLSGVGLSCTSVPQPLSFNNLAVSPIPVVTPFANSSCTGLFSNGSVRITVSESGGPGVGALYDYEGFAGGAFGPADFLSNNGNGLNDADMDSIMNLAEATYTFTVRNQVTNCPTPAQVTISYDPVASLPNIVTVDTNNPFDCFGNGGDATVSAITIGSGLPIAGSPALDPPNFRYDWYDNETDAFADPTVPGNLPGGAPTDGRFLTTLTYGTYFVKVRDLLTDCESTPVEVPIDSIAIPFPKIVIDQTRLQMSCDTLNTGSAQLAASISGDVTTTYRFTWYDDLFGTGNLLQDTDPTLVATDTLSDLKSGDYSVTAYSSVTGCESTQLFIVPDFDPAFLPRITLSGNPRTSCIFPNGSVVVKVEPFPTKNGQTYLPDVYSSYDFTLNIYDGDQKDPLTNTNPGDDPTPINATFDPLPTLPPGSFEVDSLDSDLQFTIRLIDNNTTCIVAETTIVVDDRRSPVPDIVIDNPLTNCDERVNGQLSATADGAFTSDYIFRWWDSANPPPAGDTLSYINKLIGADQGDYTVRIVNKISGCDTLATGTILFEPTYPTPPTVELIQPNDICWENYWPAEPQARPNGWLKANVEGQTAGYAFNWYVGDFTRDEIAAQTIDTTGINYLHLTGQIGNDPGVYTVSAVDLVTGCYSVLSSVVPDERVIPDGYMTTTPSRCDDVVTIGTGSAQLNMTNAVILREVTWFDSNDFQVGQGVQVFNLFPGDYRAEILTNQFCEGEVTGTIVTEIHAFNLVSVNGDSKNDDWQIDCISDYPNNNVKIFNRYGVKVYEADGYDNGQVVFRGIGENGVYTLGNSLPDGTYFFIIDKRDGSKPITGFLELVH